LTILAAERVSKSTKFFALESSNW